ncbi:hypothetical protein Tco_0010312 [Tanacetum coccineum]
MLNQILYLNRKAPTKLDSQSEKDKEIIDLNIECCLEAVKDGEPNTILELQSLTKLVSGIGGPEKDKEIIDLNIECCLETVKDGEPDTILELESATKFGSMSTESGYMNMSEKDKGKIAATCSYIGNESLVVDIGGPEYGLRGGYVDDGGCGSADGGHRSSIRSGFVSDIPGKQLILDFENFVVRLPIAIDNTEGLLIGSDFGENQIVMDFQNSIVYMLSNKRGVTNIATQSVFMAAFSGHSDIIRNIVSPDGCECSLSSSAAIAAQGGRSSMNFGHEKEQQWLGMSMAKRLAHEVVYDFMLYNVVLLFIGLPRRNCPYTDSVRNNVKNLTAGVEFENTNCHSGSYGFEVESNTIRANQYEQYFWRIGGVSSQGESSSRLPTNEKEHPNLRSSLDQILADPGVSSMYVDIGFPAQSVRSSNAIALDSPYLLVLITGTSQSRQHVDASLIHIESRKPPTAKLFDVDSGRISIVTVNTK